MTLRNIMRVCTPCQSFVLPTASRMTVVRFREMMHELAARAHGFWEESRQPGRMYYRSEYAKYLRFLHDESNKQRLMLFRSSPSVMPFNDTGSLVIPVTFLDYSTVYLEEAVGILDLFGIIAVCGRKTGPRLPLGIGDSGSSPTQIIMECVRVVKKLQFEKAWFKKGSFSVPEVAFLIAGVEETDAAAVEDLVRETWRSMGLALDDVAIYCYDSELKLETLIETEEPFSRSLRGDGEMHQAGGDLRNGTPTSQHGRAHSGDGVLRQDGESQSSRESDYGMMSQLQANPDEMTEAGSDCDMNGQEEGQPCRETELSQYGDALLPTESDGDRMLEQEADQVAEAGSNGDILQVEGGFVMV